MFNIQLFVLDHLNYTSKYKQYKLIKDIPLKEIKDNRIRPGVSVRGKKKFMAQ